MNKNTEILIVTYARDFRYLRFAVRSVARHAEEFSCCTIAVPDRDVAELDPILAETPSKIPFHVVPFEEWPRQGFLHHMYLICCADVICPTADRILHMDADCFFTRRVTPGAYTSGDKPIMVHAPYEWLIKQQANLALWQKAVLDALGWKPEHEFMRRHPSVYNRALYSATRRIIEEKHQMPLSEFMKQRRNEFPQTFAEFPTLGEVAWKHFHDDYVWRDQSKGEWPNDNPMDFCWSHREPTPDDMARFHKAGLL